MKTLMLASATAAALLFATGPAMSVTGAAVAGQKIDSGLGELPHHRDWSDPAGRLPMGTRVLGESLDNGLGELPHYSTWSDRSGRDPLGLARIQLAANQR